MRVYIDAEFRERPGTIELISIGLVRDDGAEYYAESSTFNWHDVPSDDWLQGHVRPHLTGPRRYPKVIAEDIKAFAPPQEHPEFWGWYSDYDWVVFCWLFGRMIDLPRGYPMFCLDLRQETRRLHLTKDDVRRLAPTPKDEHLAIADARWNKQLHDALLAREA